MELKQRLFLVAIGMVIWYVQSPTTFQSVMGGILDTAKSFNGAMPNNPGQTGELQLPDPSRNEIPPGIDKKNETNIAPISNITQTIAEVTDNGTIKLIYGMPKVDKACVVNGDCLQFSPSSYCDLVTGKCFKYI